jgi:hypothetical protein
MQMLERQEVKDGACPCIYRISQEGLPLILPHITRQRLQLPLGDFKALLRERALRIPKGVPYTIFQPLPATESQSSAAQGPPAAEASNDGSADVPLESRAGGSGAQSTEERPEGSSKGHSSKASTLDEGVSAQTQKGGTGFGRPAAGSEPPFIEDANLLKEVGRVCAGCCIVTLLCALTDLQLLCQLPKMPALFKNRG